MYFLVFHGKERFDQNPEAHHDADHDDGHGHDDHGHEPHESPWVVTVPLLLLAIPSVVIGYLTISPMLFGDFFKDAIFVNGEAHHAMHELAQGFHGAAAMALHAFSTAPFWLALAGVALAYYMYMINPALPAAIKRIFHPVYVLLENKYYMDWINESILARLTRGLGAVLWKVGDQTLIDGTAVNGSARLVGVFAAITRRFQTGYLYHYALAMIVGLFVFLTWFVAPWSAWLGK
jgi:NADH-quinone oxidoreductase subunit L